MLKDQNKIDRVGKIDRAKTMEGANVGGTARVGETKVRNGQWFDGTNGLSNERTARIVGIMSNEVHRLSLLKILNCKYVSIIRIYRDRSSIGKITLDKWFAFG